MSGGDERPQYSKKQVGELEQNPNQNLKESLKETFNFE
jgi:hypothetical protein